MASISEITTPLIPDESEVERIAHRTPKPVAIVPYKTEWPARFASIEALIRAALGEQVVTVQHVGSTSVAGLAAKDVIDVDLAVANLADEASYVPALEAAGFKYLLREPRWYGHRFFGLEDPYANLHVFAPDCPEHVRHCLFRDWLRAHPDDRDRYAAVKREAAAAGAAVGGETVQQYTRRKEAVIREILQRVFVAHGFVDGSSSSTTATTTT